MLISWDHPHCSWGRSPVPSTRPLVTAPAYYDISAPLCTGNCRFDYECQTENAYELIVTNKLEQFPVTHQHINKRNG